MPAIEHSVVGPGEVHTPYNWIVADQAARDALAPAAGDVNKLLYQQDTRFTYILLDHDPVTWQEQSVPGEAGVLATILEGLSTASSAVVSAADSVLSAIGKLQAQAIALAESLANHLGDVGNPHETTALQVGLGNVNNTSDLDKPISTATQAALDGKLDDAHEGAGGAAHAVAVASGAAGFMSGADKEKLDGIEPDATANATDEFLLNRGNHTGEQAIGTVTGLQAALDSKASITSPTGLLLIPTGTTAERDTDGVGIRYNSDEGEAELWNGVGWQPVGGGGGTAEFPYVQGTTTGSADVTLTSEPGSLGSIFATLGGVPQRPGLDFTFSGTTLTWTATPPIGLDYEVRWVSTAGVGEVPPDGSVTAAKLADGAVTLGKLADIATATILGRSTAGAGDPEALSREQARAVLGMPLAATPSMVRLHTGNGWGSTNTGVRRFNTTASNTGADITYADSATLGASFTINTTGIYAISYSDNFNSGGTTAALTLNCTTLNASPGSLAAAQLLAADTASTANYAVNAKWTGVLTAGDVIRAQTTTGAVGGANTGFPQFTITRVG